MKYTFYIALAITLSILAGCSGQPGAQRLLSPTGSLPAVPNRADIPATATLTQLVNLNYSNGSITVFSIQGNKATETKTFTPGRGLAQGLAVDKNGRIYTTITPSNSKPCAACVEVFSDTGKLIKRLDSPILQGAPAAPALTDLGLDAQLNVYVSDYGQQAVYFFPRARKKWHANGCRAELAKRGIGALDSERRDGLRVRWLRIRQRSALYTRFERTIHAWIVLRHRHDRADRWRG